MKLKNFNKLSKILVWLSLFTGVSVFTFILSQTKKEVYPFSEKLISFSERLRFSIIESRNTKNIVQGSI